MLPPCNRIFSLSREILSSSVSWSQSVEKAMLSNNLQIRTRYLLHNRPHWLTLKQIAYETGLSADWLSNFNRGVSTSSRVDSVQTLYEYLAGQLLFSDAGQHERKNTSGITAISTMDNMEE